MRFAVIAATLVAAVAAQSPAGETCAAPVTVTVTKYVLFHINTTTKPTNHLLGPWPIRPLLPPACPPTTQPPRPCTPPALLQSLMPPPSPAVCPLSALAPLPLLALVLPFLNSPALLLASRSVAPLPVSVPSLLFSCKCASEGLPGEC
jgi:hypothetical protein